MSIEEKAAEAVAVKRAKKKELTANEQAKLILKRARDRLARSWIAGAEVRNSDGAPLCVSSIEDKDLQLYDNAPMCSIGAIRYEARVLGKDYVYAEEVLARAIDPDFDHDDWENDVYAQEASDTIIGFNDSTSYGQSEVLKAFEEALKNLD